MEIQFSFSYIVLLANNIVRFSLVFVGGTVDV